MAVIIDIFAYRLSRLSYPDLIKEVNAVLRLIDARWGRGIGCNEIEMRMASIVIEEALKKASTHTDIIMLEKCRSLLDMMKWM